MITIEQAQEIAKSLYTYSEDLPISVTDYEDCWLINVGFRIGSGGIFVDKADGHFSEIGSVYPLDIWLWGCQNGFKHDTYDLVITKINDYEATVEFILSLGLRYPTVNSKPIAWYRQRVQVEKELNQTRPTFQDQRLGLKIPYFKEIESANFLKYELTVRRCQNKNCSYLK